MKCTVCGKQKKEEELINGVCMDCMQIRASRLPEAESQLIENIERELNSEAGKEMDVSKDAIWGKVGADNAKMTPEQFKKSKVARQLFIIALLSTSEIKGTSYERQAITDLQEIIDNDLDKFWGKKIHLVRTRQAGSSSMLAYKGDTCIVEIK